MSKQASNGILGRGFRLGKLGLTLTGSYLGYQLQNLLLGERRQPDRHRSFYRKASRQVREELQAMKGPAMKLGQMLSLLGHRLPAEAIDELSGLQAQAPPMHAYLARAQFKASCGKYPEEVFRQFEPEPFAAASLGQVHRAVTKGGELVAVKVQYPAIRQAVANDFKLLRSTTLTGQVTGHLPKALLDELESGILKETDYLNEARNLEFFRAGLEPLPFVTVPKVFRELSTDRVLTMSYLEGDPALEFLAKAPARPLRDLLGTRLAELFYFQLHGLHALHADGHPGNYFFSPDGQIGLVDFGCVKHFSGSFVEMARALADRAWEKGPEQFDRLLRLIWGPEAPRNRHARRILTKAISVMEEIVPANESDPRLIDCDDSKLVESLSEVITECLRNKLTNPEFVFYMRADLGLFNLLRLLGARFDTSVIFTVRNKLALRRGTGLPACRDGAGRPA